jgi:UDP-glucose 4-epimerase
MSVFIAGGCGFIGLNLAEAWLKRGAEVILFDRNPLPPVAATAFAGLPGRVEVTVDDIRDPEAVADAMADRGITHAYYGAAVTSGPEREKAAPESVLEINLMGLVNVLKAAAGCGVGRLINISSGSAYGPVRLGIGWDGTLVEEVAPSDPDSLYAISKFASERVVRRYASLTGLDALSVRLAAIYGPWEIDSGARDTLSPQMQAALLARSGKPAVLARRDHQDWTYSRHVGEALVALGQAEAPAHDLYHVTCGHRWAVADWCERLAGHFPGFSHRLAKAGETPSVNLHGERDRLPMSGERLAQDIGHRLPGDPAAAHEDFIAWIDAHGAFWDA